jgi:L-alanine-DL-glutamate epimerase-like enolase superfamily enzyme
MHITSITALPVSLPMKKPVIMAGEEVRRAENVLVKIVADDGRVGWGEAASAPVMTGETLESIVAAIHHLTPALIGRDARDIGGALRAMHGRLYGNHGARAALEIALHDLAAQDAQCPVHALLGKKLRDRMPLLGIVGGGDFDGDLADAAKKKADGFAIYKIKVGVDTAKEDATRTRAICELLGRGALISADANQGFSREDALAYVRAVDGPGLSFFEQPLDAHDLDGMAQVAAATSIAIGADEGIHSLADIRAHHAAKAARGVSLKAIKLGGIDALTQAGRLCGDLGMAVNISCKTGESSVACAAALHAACVIPAVDWGVTMTHTGLAVDVTSTPIPTARGHVDALDRIGLGVEVDEDLIEQYRVGVSGRSHTPQQN